jgi:hypothetical protein
MMVILKYCLSSALLLIDKEDSIKRCPITNTGINIANIPGMNRAVLTTYHHNSDSIIQFIDTESLNIGKQVLIADDRQYFSITIIKDKIYLGSADVVKTALFIPGILAMLIPVLVIGHLFIESSLSISNST